MSLTQTRAGEVGGIIFTVSQPDGTEQRVDVPHRRGELNRVRRWIHDIADIDEDVLRGALLGSQASNRLMKQLLLARALHHCDVCCMNVSPGQRRQRAHVLVVVGVVKLMLEARLGARRN